MRLLMLIATSWALVASKPEIYREKEDFQFSRSSSDDGSKSGYYGAQRGNMGGNYEKAHNMDALAQRQMSTLVNQVDGELGEGANMRTGSVFSAANSRGIYGSGQYDLSNLKGRNFAEGTSLGDSLSRSSMSENAGYSGYSDYSSLHSGANNERYSNSQWQSSGHNSGYKTSDLTSQQLQIDEQKADNSYGASNYKYDSQSGSNDLYNQRASQSRTDYNNANFNNANGYDYSTRTRLLHATPARVYIRPGTRVAIPVAAQTYDASQTSSALNQDTISSDAEMLSNNHRLNSRPTNTARRYESSYSYRKEWEKHDTVTSTENPFPKNSELYEDAQVSRAANQHAINELGSTNTRSSNANSAYSSEYNTNTKTASSSQSRQQVHTGTHSSGTRASNANAINRFSMGAAANILDNHNTDGTANSNSLVEDTGIKPKSYQSSYSYHKSWERRGDPYIIRPSSDVNEQTSQRLTAASTNQGYSSHQYNCGYCLDESQQRVRRSLSMDEYLQNQHLHEGYEQAGLQPLNELNAGQEIDSRWENLPKLEQTDTENNWDDSEKLGQQSQSEWDNLETLNQQPQSQLSNLEDLGQQSQNTWGNLQDLGQQSQNEWNNLENLGQQTQNEWGKLDELGQETQNKWDKFENVGQQAQNQWNQLDELHQQNKWEKPKELSQQTNLEELSQQTNLEELSQQTQSQNGELESTGHQNIHEWEKLEQTNNGLEDLGQQTQNQWNKFDMGQETQSEWKKQENVGQESQSKWSKFENLGQQSHNEWSKLDNLDQRERNLEQQSQSDNIANFGQENLNTESNYRDIESHKTWTEDTRHTPEMPYYAHNEPKLQEPANLYHKYMWEKIDKMITEIENNINLDQKSNNENFKFEDQTPNNSPVKTKYTTVDNTEYKQLSKSEQSEVTEYNKALDRKPQVTPTTRNNDDGLGKNSSQITTHPVDIGRGDIGSEDTLIESTNSDEEKNYKTPEEIESLSLTKEINHQTESNNFKEPLILSVTGLNQQGDSVNEKNPLNKLNTLVESVTVSAPHPKENNRDELADELVKLINSLNNIGFKERYNNSLQMPASTWQEEKRQIEPLEQRNIGQQLDNFEQQNWKPQSQSFEQQNIGHKEPQSQDLEQQNMGHWKPQSQSFEQQNMGHKEPQSQDLEQQNMGHWKPQLQSFEQQNMGHKEPQSRDLEQQNMGHWEQQSQDLEQQNMGHWEQQSQDLEQQNIGQWEPQSQDLEQQNIDKPLEPFAQHHLDQKLNPFEEQNMGQYLEPFNEQILSQQLEPIKKPNVEHQNKIKSVSEVNSYVDLGQKAELPIDETMLQNLQSNSEELLRNSQTNAKEQNGHYSNQNIEQSFSTPDIPIEVTTKKPGFWHSLWNKTKDTKDAVVSWLHN